MPLSNQLFLNNPLQPIHSLLYLPTRSIISFSREYLRAPSPNSIHHLHHGVTDFRPSQGPINSIATLHEPYFRQVDSTKCNRLPTHPSTGLW